RGLQSTLSFLDGKSLEPLKGKLHVISKRYTQRIERHNLNLRQHLARLGRKSLSFSKSVELHDKVIGHYLNIKHYQ
ncbi:IS1 family transposase, partial [Enterobacter hormaechei]|uniref:IS1 family transposase n=1 Tax=Enterobacter hormaechei TaxID=158836 RepID=UPI0022F11F5E